MVIDVLGDAWVVEIIKVFVKESSISVRAGAVTDTLFAVEVNVTIDVMSGIEIEVLTEVNANFCWPRWLVCGFPCQHPEKNLCLFVEQREVADHLLSWTPVTALCRPGCPRTTCAEVLCYQYLHSF